MEKEEDY